MPIISIDVNAPGMSGVKPKAIFIDTNDTADDVLVAGYLDHIVAQGVPISTSEVALVTTRPTPNSSDVTTSWYGITFSAGQWSLVEQGGGGGAGVVLPTTANHIATYVDDTGLLSQNSATAINNGNITAIGNLTAGDSAGGHAGEVHIYPATVSSGSVIIKANNVTGGNFTSTIANNASLTASKTYTLPNTEDFTPPPTLVVYDGFSASTQGNLAVFGSHAGTLTDGGAAPATILRQSSSSNLTSATITTLDGSGLQLVPNPFPGFPVYGLLLHYLIIKFTYGTTPYTGTTGNFYMSYDSAGAVRASMMLPQSVFAATTNRTFIIYPDPTLNDYLKSDIIQNGLYFVADNNMADGDSSINISAVYSQVDLT